MIVRRLLLGKWCLTKRSVPSSIAYLDAVDEWDTSRPDAGDLAGWYGIWNLLVVWILPPWLISGSDGRWRFAIWLRGRGGELVNDIELGEAYSRDRDSGLQFGRQETANLMARLDGILRSQRS